MMGKLYFFIVHSHSDASRVKVIRNLFERQDVEPITMLLDEKTDYVKIDKLIKDEIDRRVWFVYCKSPAATNSRWVQSELAYIKKNHRQIDIEIDLDRDFTDLYLRNVTRARIVSGIEAIKKANSMFCSYVKEDARRVNEIRKYLESKKCDCKTYCLGQKWESSNTYEIQNTSTIVAFISKETLESNRVLKMIELALKWKKAFVPVFLDDVNLLKNKESFVFLEKFDGFNFDHENFEKSCQALLRKVLSMIS